MRRNYLYIIVACLSCFALACQNEEIDTTAPGKLSDVEVVPTYGGAKFTYTLPNDDDRLFVKASYVNTLGEPLFKVSSFYQNELEIDGYNDTDTHTATLVVVDRSNNESEAVEVSFTPLESNIHMVLQSTNIEPTFGGVIVSWDNPQEQTIFSYLSYTDGLGNEIVEYLSSNKASDQVTIRGIDTLATEFFVQVEDFYGNKTDVVSKGEVKPFFEEQIRTDDWSVLRSMSANGTIWEATTESLFDGIVDVIELGGTVADGGNDSYALFERDNNGGALTYPLDVVIDTNTDSVTVGRITVWQRAFTYIGEGNVPNDTYFYYNSENIKGYEVWTSTDKNNWTLIGGLSLDDPSDDEGNIPEEAILEAIAGHSIEFEVPETVYRYVKFSITENFGSEIYCNVSEFAMFGVN